MLGAVRWSVPIGHGIIPGAAPGLTASKTLQTQPAPVKNAVRLNSFQKVR
jgi:hypothetical protein